MSSEVYQHCHRCEKLKRALSEGLPSEFRRIFWEAYQEAGMSGLCHEGRLEYAVNAINSKDLSKIIQDISEQ